MCSSSFVTAFLRPWPAGCRVGTLRVAPPPRRGGRGGARGDDGPAARSDGPLVGRRALSRGEPAARAAPAPQPAAALARALWATLHGADEIALGVTADDAAKAKAGAENTGTFSSAFVRDFGALARGVAGVELTTPLAESTKPQVLERGRAAGVDFALTFSCMRGADGQHCGTCDQCRARRAAFAAAGIAERPGFYSNGGGS